MNRLTTIIGVVCALGLLLLIAIPAVSVTDPNRGLYNFPCSLTVEGC